MSGGQRLMRVITDVVVRRPRLWRLARGVVARNFDRLAPEWDALRVDEARLRPIDAALAAVPATPARVLDLGTGSGAVARLAAARWPAAQVTGADVSQQMILEARRLATSDREHYQVADASELPFPDGTFDLVALNNMIPFFDELARVVAPGGHVAVAYSLGDRTPIYVPLPRVRAELERRGLAVVLEQETGPGLSLLAARPRSA
jgi:ubiquinone/menaquinone biosynthesis C-methylase UbiE